MLCSPRDTKHFPKSLCSAVIKMGYMRRAVKTTARFAIGVLAARFSRGLFLSLSPVISA